MVDSYDCVGRDNTGWGSICFDVKLHIASAIIGYDPSREQNGPNETLIPGLPRE